MLETIETFAIAVPESGPAGLAIPHLGRGEIREAIWLGASGLRLRADRGSTWVKMSLDVMGKYWRGESTLQVLETEAGKPDQCWLVPLTNAPAALAKQSKTGI